MCSFEWTFEEAHVGSGVLLFGLGLSEPKIFFGVACQAIIINLIK